MSKISFKPADTGTATFTLEAPATNTNRTITLPDEAGTLATVENLPSGDITSGDLPAGSVIQVVQSSHATEVKSSSTTFIDTDLNASITPSSVSNKILVLVSQPLFVDNNDEVAGCKIRVLRDSTTILNHDQATVFFFNSASVGQVKLGMVYNVSPLDSPATTSQITYKTQVALSTSAGFFEANAADLKSTITLMEIAG